MRHADDTDRQKGQEVTEAKSGAEKPSEGRFLPWVAVIVVVTVCAGAGFGLGRLLAGSGTPEATESESRPDESSRTENLRADDDSAKRSKEVWYGSRLLDEH